MKVLASNEGHSRSRSLLRRNSIVIVKWCFAAAAIAVVIRFDLVDMRLIGQQLTHPIALTAAIALVLATYPVATIRWRLLLAESDIILRFAPTFDIITISSFIGLFLPGNSADAVRIGYAIPAAPGRRVAAVVSILVDRLFGLAALLTLGAILALSRPLDEGWPQAQYLIWGLAVAALLAVTASVIVARTDRPIAGRDGSKFRFILEHLIEPLRRLARRPILMIQCFLLSLVVQGALLSSIAIIGVAVDPETFGFKEYALAGAVALCANLVPLTPGGIGIGEAAFAEMCAIFAGHAVMASGNVFLLFRACAALVSALGLYSFVRFRGANGEPGGRDAMPSLWVRRQRR